MRSSRTLMLVALFVVLAGALTVAGCGSSKKASSSSTRVDALFDDASFADTGQDVRIAGATVGKVTKVTLTSDRLARIEMAVDPKFLPFRADASCSILPQSLIGERFLDCSPGKPDAKQLVKGDGPAPTVPLKANHSPVDLDAVVAMLGQPVNVRLQLLVNEFGAAGAARGPALSAAIRRSVPALAATRKTLGIVEGQRDALGRLLTATNQVVGALDRSKDQLGGTFEDTARLLKITSDYRRQLGQTIKVLPPTLSALKPTLRQVSQLTRDATPTLVSLRRSSPALRQLAGDLHPLSNAARPALKRLARASRVATPILQRAIPQLARVRQVATALQPVTPQVADLARSLSDNGVPERAGQLLFNLALSASRYDSTSHLIPALPVLTPAACLLPATVPVPGCESSFAAERQGLNAPTRAQTRALKQRKLLRDAPADPGAKRSTDRTGRTR